VAVKDGPILGPPEGLVLDGREHDGRLVCVGIDGRRVMPALVIVGTRHRKCDSAETHGWVVPRPCRVGYSRIGSILAVVVADHPAAAIGRMQRFRPRTPATAVLGA
jgi:hypothetical protein